MWDSEIIPLIWAVFTLVHLIFLIIVKINTSLAKELKDTTEIFPKVSVLIPMRNESSHVNEIIQAFMKQNYPNFEVLILDDHSTDDTWLKLISMQWMYPHILLFKGKELPEKWLGKNFACAQLAEKAHGDILLFADADVLPEPHAIMASVAALQKNKLDFLSAFPEQILLTQTEKQIVPFMDFFLYTFLPLPLVRHTKIPAFTAANGQWMVFTKEAYEKTGGHTFVKNKIIEDMALAREIKKKGLTMDVYSGINSLRCRMYENAEQVKAGFGKNAFAAAGYSVSNMLLFLALAILLFLLPFLFAFIYPPLIVNVFIVLGIKYLLAKRFRHPMRESVWQHPVSMLKAIQVCLHSIKLYRNGKAEWKERSVQI